MENIPQAILTSDKNWDPTSLDYEGKIDNEIWFDAQSSFQNVPDNKNFNEVGNYRHRSNLNQTRFFDAK